MNDSEVSVGTYYHESDSGAAINDSAVNSANMPNPGDGGPGGGGIVIDGGDQPTINYDANGNLISYKGWVYRYDAQNRLIYASNGTTSATFYYDGKNRQIARNINGVIRFNSWDGWELVEEYSSSLNVATGYLQGTTGVIKSWRGANTLYYYQDKLGSTTHVANASGQLVESYHYDLYGTPSYFNSTSQPLNSSTVGVTDLYAGERWIPELALYDLRNRFMSPELGRFLQADPIGFQGDASNLYRYYGNDPINKSDPFGLVPPADGLIDLPRKTVQEIAEAMKNNIKRTQTEKSPDGPGGKPRHQEHRTMAYDNGKGERKTSTETGRHENGIYPYTEKPKNPFNTPATPAWDSHSHISGSGKPYAPHDFNSADRLGVPSGVQSATGGPLYIYVPSATRGGEGGLFRVEGVRLINDATGQEAPH
jgi:RHS repeat-associated protein